MSRAFSKKQKKEGEFLIYKNIELKCAQRGITISALEKNVGLGNATIKGWEKSSPRVESLKKVADYFGCTIDDLIGTKKRKK